jgi:homogentisate 1,2-dioxygenase
MPVTKFSVPEKYTYLSGFGGYHQYNPLNSLLPFHLTDKNSSEAIPGALPIGINSPQLPPFSLSTERISGTSFTAPRSQNLQTWLYRVHSSLSHSDFSPFPSSYHSPSIPSSDEELHLTPNALRWNDIPVTPNQDWISSQKMIAKSGSPAKKEGLAYLIYAASESMPAQTVFSSSDSDYLIIPQSGTLDIHTELGHLLVRQTKSASYRAGSGTESTSRMARREAISVNYIKGISSFPNWDPLVLALLPMCEISRSLRLISKAAFRTGWRRVRQSLGRS